MTRRSVPAGVALLALLATPCRGQDPVAEAAERVLAAHRAGDADAMREVADGTEADPWSVADAVWRTSADAARAFASAVPGDRGARLSRFLAGRGAPDANVEALLRDLPALEPEEGLRRLDTLRPADPLQRAGLELARADILARQGAPAAARSFRQAADECRAIGWIDGMAQAAAAGAALARRTGQLKLAIELLETQDEAESLRENPAGRADALLNLGGIRGHLGDYQDAIETLRRAEALASEAGARRLAILALGSQAVVHKRRGAFQMAIRTLETALRAAEGDEDAAIRARLLADLGSAYQEIGAFDDAERRHRAALALLERLEDAAGTARVWGDLGVGFSLQGRFAEAKECLVRAERSFQQPDLRRATVLLNLGYVLGFLDEPKAAREALEQAIDLTRELRAPWHEGHAWWHLGIVEGRAGRQDDALTAYEHCRKLGDDVGSSVLREQAHLGRARALLARGEFEDALEAGRAAMGQVSRQVAGLSLAGSFEARARHADVYAIAARAAMGTGTPEALFEVLERGRASAFLEAISDRDTLRNAVVPAELRTAEEAAQRAVVRATETFRAAYTRGALEDIDRERKALADAETRLDEVQDRLQREARSASALLYPRAASLTEVQERLAKRDALVAYGVLDEAIALVVTREEARIARLGAEVLPLCRDYDPTDPGRLDELGRRLVEPLGLPDEVRRVLVTLDGDLARVPVSALMAGRDVAVIPSASTYLVLQDQRGDAGQDVLAVGVGRYAKDRRLGPLPAAEDEARSVGDVHLLGPGATLSALREALDRTRRWRALHLACHGRFDSEQPLLSALALTETETEDGWLTAAEVFALRVPADLVVLASCHGGEGRFVPGEGLVGLTRAFLYAGAPRVISSAWTVDDAASTALMAEFYRQWRGNGESTSRALRLAREHVRKQPQWSGPRYWAGWQLWGLPD